MVVVRQDPRELKLFREGAELRDSTTLAEAQVQNGDTLAMTYALPDGASQGYQQHSKDNRVDAVCMWHGKQCNYCVMCRRRPCKV